MVAMRTRTRWTVAAAATAAVVGGALVVPAVASADPDLPPTTAADLLEDLATASERPFSGTVVQTVDLGLPELPQGMGGSSELMTLLAGSTTLRLWSDGPERTRVAVLGALAESDLVRDGDDAWLWRSDQDTALHADLSALPQHPEGEERAPMGGTGAASPADAARAALDALDPTTEVSVDGTATVAGRDAYELVLEPRSEDSLVGEVRLAVDAETSYPLRAQVTARGATEPAFESGFTSISFTTPGDEVFDFTPPAGTEVQEVDPAQLSAMGGHDDPSGATSHPGAAPGEAASPTVVGEGWTSVLVLRDAAGALDPTSTAREGSAKGGDEDEAAAELGATLLGAFQPVEGEYGSGRAFSSALLSALALDDGRVLVGAVPVEVLERAALDPTAAP